MFIKIIDSIIDKPFCYFLQLKTIIRLLIGIFNDDFSVCIFQNSYLHLYYVHRYNRSQIDNILILFILNQLQNNFHIFILLHFRYFYNTAMYISDFSSGFKIQLTWSISMQLILLYDPLRKSFKSSFLKYLYFNN